jgi:hypothetical protein
MFTDEQISTIFKLTDVIKTALLPYNEQPDADHELVVNALWGIIVEKLVWRIEKPEEVLNMYLKLGRGLRVELRELAEREKKAA